MCYFIYGAVNKETNLKDLEQLLSGSGYFFRHGTKHDVKEAAMNDSEDYCVRKSICDCKFPIGMGNADAPELKALSEAIHKLRGARGIKCVYLAKAWAGKLIRSEQRVHVEDIAIESFLADASENCLYRIDLYGQSV